MRKLKRTDISKVTVALLKKQEYRCALCGGSLRANAAKNPALDHCHQTGAIRDVLCINCNGIEGKIFNLARRAKNEMTPVEWIDKLAAYWRRHSTSQHNLIHPTHKTEEEKREERNRKARERRRKHRSA